MPRLLMLEGNPLESRLQARELGERTTSEIYVEAIRSHFPDIGIDVIYAADRGQALPVGAGFESYDGCVVSGSVLRAFDDSFEVKNQIALLSSFSRTGRPILGSCWGLQIAAITAGGEVGPSPRGREFGIARKVTLNSSGRAHVFLAGKPASFDAPCVHQDEVTRLPAGATLLCSNAHSKVQAAIMPLGGSEVWGVQYHPEFDLRQLSMLMTLYADDLVRQGFYKSKEDLRDFQARFGGLIDDPGDRALSWQLGLDSDILDDNIRHLEIINWVNQQILNKPG